jgi:putative transposase
MDRLRGLPGATAEAAVRPRRGRAKPQEGAALTLAEFERWIALEIAERYHQSPHRGLMGATPASLWQTLTVQHPPRLLPAAVDAQLSFLIRFLPLAQRSVQNDGLTLAYIRYWHPVFASWRAQGKRVLVRYHPEDLSRIYASVNGKDYVEAPYADLRRPRISLAEQRAVCKMLRIEGQRVLTEERLFAAIEAQREIVRRALADTRRVRREERKGGGQGRGARKRSTPIAGAVWKPPPEPPSDEVDYSKPAPPYPVELW